MNFEFAQVIKQKLKKPSQSSILQKQTSRQVGQELFFAKYTSKVDERVVLLGIFNFESLKLFKNTCHVDILCSSVLKYQTTLF